MQNQFTTPLDVFSTAAFFIRKSFKAAPKLTRAAFAQSRAANDYWTGIFNYVSSFMSPSKNALNAFLNAEKENLSQNDSVKNMNDYKDLMDFNVNLATKGMAGSLKAMNTFYYQKLSEGFQAWLSTLYTDGEEICDFASRQEQLLKVAVRNYPKAIDEIKAEYGFHFDNGGYDKVAETERFDLYRILPTDKSITLKQKPVLIIPPYVLGANILAFLPGERRSYVHCFANQGIPTYIRVVKDIDTTPAVQLMTGEDDALDMKYFCNHLLSAHDLPVTLNGFCQGGYHALAAMLAGELDGTVDALITCATPVDGSRSKSLKDYMMSLPARFRDMRFSIKELPNGNKVVDGKILGWVYKLRKLETEAPVASFHRDIGMFDGQQGPRTRIGKTAAAINHWLTYDQKDLPISITEMSFESYLKPIDEEGNLPVTLFGRTLNLKRIQEKKIPWLICIADADDMVDREASLVALNYIDAEVCVFPKGHVSIATSWSLPTSACALHMRFGSPGQRSRGPVLFQMELDNQLLKIPMAAIARA